MVTLEWQVLSNWSPGPNSEHAEKSCLGSAYYPEALNIPTPFKGNLLLERQEKMCK